MDEYEEGKVVTAKVTREQGLFNHGLKSASSYLQSASNTDEDFSWFWCGCILRSRTCGPAADCGLTHRISGNSVNKESWEVETSGTVCIWSS